MIHNLYPTFNNRNSAHLRYDLRVMLQVNLQFTTANRSLALSFSLSVPLFVVNSNSSGNKARSLRHAWITAHRETKTGFPGRVCTFRVYSKKKTEKKRLNIQIETERVRERERRAAMLRLANQLVVSFFIDITSMWRDYYAGLLDKHNFSWISTKFRHNRAGITTFIHEFLYT